MRCDFLLFKLNLWYLLSNSLECFYQLLLGISLWQCKNAKLKKTIIFLFISGMIWILSKWNLFQLWTITSEAYFFSKASKPFKANESNCKMTSSNQVQKKRAGNEKGNVFRFTCQLNFERHPYHRCIRWNCDAFYHCVYFFLFDDFPFLHQFFSPNAWFRFLLFVCALLLFDLKQVQS